MFVTKDGFIMYDSFDSPYPIRPVNKRDAELMNKIWQKFLDEHPEFAERCKISDSNHDSQLMEEIRKRFGKKRRKP